MRYAKRPIKYVSEKFIVYIISPQWNLCLQPNAIRITDCWSYLEKLFLFRFLFILRQAIFIPGGIRRSCNFFLGSFSRKQFIRFFNYFRQFFEVFFELFLHLRRTKSRRGMVNWIQKKHACGERSRNIKTENFPVVAAYFRFRQKIVHRESSKRNNYFRLYYFKLAREI